jgi:hypothetical protein
VLNYCEEKGVNGNTSYNCLLEIRGSNVEALNITRSKVCHIEQNIGARTRSKLQAIFNSTNKVVFFLFHDAICFKD